MGITTEQIEKLKKSMPIGSRFEFRKVAGRVVEKHKNFVVIERDSGYKECFKWIEMLTEGESKK